MAEYPIPPWLGPQTQFGELYARGRAIGQAIENQRTQAQLQMRAMDQQAANAQLEAQVQSMRINAQMQMAQQEALQRQQASAIEADYRQMMLAQAREKMMQEATQNEQRMKLDLFKANTDWQKASRSFDAENQMSQWINNRSKVVGLEQATKEGYMMFGHLLGGSMPGGIFPNERQDPSITGIKLPDGRTVNVVQGGQVVPELGQANVPPTMVAPGLAQVPKSGGGFEYRNIDTQFKSKYDDRIAKMEDSFFGKFLLDRSLKAESDDFQKLVDAQRKLYDRLVSERAMEEKAFKSSLPGSTMATNAPSTGTTNRSFNWTGSALTPR